MASGKPNVHSQLNLKDLNNAMRREAAGVATRWYELGVELLDSNTAVLDVIQSDHQSDNARCSKMFKAWLEMKPDASWSQLVTALNNIGLNTAADNLRQSKMSNKVTDLVQIPTIIMKSDPGDTNTISTAEQASVEFGVLLNEILEELMKNENKNLKLLKRTSSTLTLKDNSGVKIFSDSQVEAIYACNDIETLLIIKLRHCYRWDDHSMLTVLMSSLNAEECLRLLHLFETKIYGKIKLQQLHEHCLQEKVNIPEGYHKMVLIVNKIFSSITKEEYDELKKFISQYCGVESYVMSPFSQVSPFNSMVIEWFIPVNAVSYMIETAKINVHMFTKEIFLYLKISSTVIFDHRDNKLEYYQLLTAAEAGDVVTVERLIHARYIDVNTTDVLGMTALHDAAWKGQVQAIETLIRLGADVNVLTKWGSTALHVAAWEGQVQAIETLIRLGADVNALNRLRRTALHEAAICERVQAIETLIRLGADVKALDQEGSTALHDAAWKGQVQAIETLIRLGAVVNALDEFGRTALHCAAMRKHVQAIETLIRLGADVNALDRRGSTALHLAALRGHVQAIGTLIRLGADMNALDENNSTPLLLALQYGNRDAVQFLVNEAKVDTTQLDQPTQSRIKGMSLPLPSSSKWSDISSVSSGYSSASGSSGWSSHSVSSTGRTKSSSTSTSTTKQSSIIRDHKSTTGESEVLEMKQKEQESKTL